MATSTNYGWTEPDNTDLVTNGALAIRTLGNAIDTSLWNSGYGQAGKNKIINGSMQIAQRGTTFTDPTSSATAYCLDRWQAFRAGFAAGITTSRQNSGITGIQYATRIQRNSGNANTSAMFFLQNIETSNSIPVAGQAVAFSFYLKVGANYSGGSIACKLISGTGTDQNYITGSFTGEVAVINSTVTGTTSYQRFTLTGTVPTTCTELAARFDYTPTGTASTNDWIEITGVQVEVGAKATPFQTASGNSPQGELAMCQRYYVRFDASASSYSNFPGAANAYATNGLAVQTVLPVTMRDKPTSIESSTLRATDGVADYALSGVTLSSTNSSKNVGGWYCSATGLTQYRSYATAINASSSGYLGFSAEL